MKTQNAGGVITNLAAVQHYQSSKSENAGVIATRLALSGLTQAAAQELAKFNIRVNAVLHRGVDSWWTALSDGRYETLKLDSEVTPDDSHSLAEGKTAALILQLCSDAAAHISGQILKGDDELDMP